MYKDDLFKLASSLVGEKGHDKEVLFEIVDIGYTNIIDSLLLYMRNNDDYSCLKFGWQFRKAVMKYLEDEIQNKLDEKFNELIFDKTVQDNPKNWDEHGSLI